LRAAQQVLKIIFIRAEPEPPCSIEFCAAEQRADVITDFNASVSEYIGSGAAIAANELMTERI
jgi:hypothetical protein